MLIAFIGTTKDKTLQSFYNFVQVNEEEFKIVSDDYAVLKDDVLIKIITIDNYQEHLDSKYDQIILSEPINDNEEYAKVIAAFRTNLTGNIVNGMEEQVCG